MKKALRNIVLTLIACCALILPAAAQSVQGRHLASGGTPEVVWSREYQSSVGRIPNLNFQAERDTFYHVEVFTWDRAVDMGISDLGNRLRARADQRDNFYSGGHRVYRTSFSYNPDYQGQYKLHVRGQRGQQYTYRVTKYKVRSASNNGLTVNRSRQQYNRTQARHDAVQRRRGQGGRPTNYHPTSIYGF